MRPIIQAGVSAWRPEGDELWGVVKGASNEYYFDILDDAGTVRMGCKFANSSSWGSFTPFFEAFTNAPVTAMTRNFGIKPWASFNIYTPTCFNYNSGYQHYMNLISGARAAEQMWAWVGSLD